MEEANEANNNKVNLSDKNQNLPTEPIHFEQKVGQIVVSADADKDVFPLGTQMEVSLIDNEQSDEYQAALNALESNSVTYDGVQVIDISFKKDGKEIEPDGQVKVQMQFDQNLINADQDGMIEIHHINEEKGSVVETVASTETEEISKNGQKYQAEFTVDSFSQFTITWTDGGWTTYFSSTNYLVDESGKELDNSSIKDYSTSSPSSTQYFSELGKKNAPDGYEYKETRLGSSNGETVDTLVLTRKRENYNYNYTYTATLKSGSKEIKKYSNLDSEPKNISLYFVYQKAPDWRIVFDANGGNGTPPDSITGTDSDDAKVKLPGPNTLKKQGWTFVGWTTKKPSHETTDGYLIYKQGDSFPVSRGTTTLYAVWTQNDFKATAEFYIYTKDGEIPTEPGQYDAPNYTDAISINNAITKNHWIIDRSIDPDNSDPYLDENKIADPKGVNANNNVSQNLRSLPTAEQIYNALKAAKNDSEKQVNITIPETLDKFKQEYYILWYVQKVASSTWHIDGVLLKKQLMNVTYDANTGGLYSGPIPLSYQTSKNTEIIVGTQTADRNSNTVDPVWEGHTFLGWTLEKNPGPNATYIQGGAPYKITKSTTFYAQWAINKVILTVEKKVKGNLADLNKEFSFTVNVWENGSDSTPIEHQFKLQNNGQKTIEIPIDAKYQIVENDANDYETTYKVDNGSVLKAKSTNKNTIKANTTVTFTNTKETHNPITGLGDHNSLAWIIGLAGGTAMIILLIWMKKYRYEKE